MPLYQLTAHELHEKLKAQEITSAELTQSVYERIDAVEGQIEGYITLTKETAYLQAEAADAGFQRGDEMSAACRHSHRGQRRYLHQRCINHLRLQDSRQLRAAIRCQP